MKSALRPQGRARQGPQVSLDLIAERLGSLPGAVQALRQPQRAVLASLALPTNPRFIG